MLRLDPTKRGAAQRVLRQRPAAGSVERTSAAGDREALSLIGKLLAKPGVYEGTRLELEGYKEDIAAGEFTGADRTYLRALHARMAKGK